MPLSLNCPNCSKRFSVPDSAAGRKGQCPLCATEIQIPGVPVVGEAGGAAYGADRGAPAGAQSQPPSLDESGNSKACPYCGEAILAQAKKCKHCGEYLDASLRQEAGRSVGRSDAAIAKAQRDINSAFFGSLVGILICGPIIEPLCMYQANKAAKILDTHKVKQKRGLATATMVIGWIYIAFFVLFVIASILDKT